MNRNSNKFFVTKLLDIVENLMNKNECLMFFKINLSQNL
jgi:hypothetical protein